MEMNRIPGRVHHHHHQWRSLLGVADDADPLACRSPLMADLICVLLLFAVFVVVLLGSKTVSQHLFVLLSALLSFHL